MKKIDPCKDQLAICLTQALTKIGVAQIPDLNAIISRPPDRALGDFAFPCFRFAKELRLPPQKIAESLVAEIPSTLGSAKAVAGFLNVRANDLIRHALEVSSDRPFHENSVVEKVMVEYSQPNTHKEFHVGHMRNAALGASLIRILRYCGYPVIAANYFGDEGAHIAKCLWMLKKDGIQPPQNFDLGAWLGSIYTKAVLQLDKLDPTELQKAEGEISAILRNIETKSGDDYLLWQRTREWSLDSFRKIYQWMAAPFDREFFESEVSTESQQIVDDYVKKGIFVHSEGAIGINLEDEKLGFLLLRKRDGNTLYATKDLALARRKFEEFGVDRSLYVVANEQDHHFRQVFSTLKKIGFKQAGSCVHISYGMVVLPTGKMSSRAGNTIPFWNLVDNLSVALEQPLEKYRQQWSQAEMDVAKKKLSLAAVMYGMLKSDSGHQIVYQQEEWLSFEGDTGPYLLYSYARARAILRKAGEIKKINPVDAATKLSTEEERDVARHIYDFVSIIVESCDSLKPSHLCHHLFHLCKAFNRFYTECPILNCEDEGIKVARLLLVTKFTEVLKKGLSLLGIETIDQM